MAEPFGWVFEENEAAAADAAAQAAAERVRRSVKTRREGIPTKVLGAIGEIPQHIVGAGMGMVDAAKRSADEQFPSQSAPFSLGAPMTVSTDDDPRNRAGLLAGETALNLIGVPGLTGNIAAGSAGIFGGRLAKTADKAKLAQARTWRLPQRLNT